MYSRYFNELPVSLDAVGRVLAGDPVQWLPGAKWSPSGSVEFLTAVGPPGGAAPRKRVRITIGTMAVEADQVRLPLGWKATGAGFLFPEMTGELEASRWDGDSTLLSLQVDYTPPLGALGRQLDQRLLHHLAWSTLRTFRDGISESLGVLAAIR